MRSDYKSPAFFNINANKEFFSKKNRKFVYKTKNRNLRVFKSMVGRKFRVYNGRRYRVVDVGPSMLGAKLGEFSFTRVTVHHQRRKREKALAKKRKEELKKLPKVKIVDKQKIAAARSKRKSRK